MLSTPRKEDALHHRVILLPAHGPPRFASVLFEIINEQPNLLLCDLQKLVGGYVGIVPRQYLGNKRINMNTGLPHQHEWVLYGDDEALLKNVPLNAFARLRAAGDLVLCISAADGRSVGIDDDALALLPKKLRPDKIVEEDWQ